MGLDPPTLMTLSPLLHRLARASSPRLILTLRPQDPIPEWITHLMYLTLDCNVALQGKKNEVLENLHAYVQAVEAGVIKGHPILPTQPLHEVGRKLTSGGVLEPAEARKQAGLTSTEAGVQGETLLSRDGYPMHDTEKSEIGEALVEMAGVRLSYGEKTVLGNWKQDVDGTTKDGLWWNIRRGERIGIFGPNGSGKTTILSLICSDHPQTYSLPIKLFGRSRLPEFGKPGISIFDIQARIGHSSPEVQNFFPKRLTVRASLESAWADTFLGKPKLDEKAHSKVAAALRWFESELRGVAMQHHGDSLLWADDLMFGRLPFSAQRVALFLRAIIKNPDLVILDEAFSGMDDAVRDKCMLFLAYGEHMTFAYDAGEAVSEQKQKGAAIVESKISKTGQVKVQGLQNEQALLCISHVKEEIPGSVREWICLPEANTGKPARFGRFDGPLDGNSKRWNEIWGIE